jgi:methyl-accepting chemotaxis protein
VRLFRSLGFTAKAACISLAFLLPMALVFWLYLSMLLGELRMVRNERAGVVAMVNFVDVLGGLVNTRNATRAALGGYAAKEDYKKFRIEVDTALARFEGHLANGDPLHLQKPLDDLKRYWQDTASALNGVDAQGRTVFGPVTKAATELLQIIGDNSELVLDPALDSFYIVNAAVLTMPRVIEDSGQLWGWGTYAAAKAGLGAAGEKRWHVWSASVANGVEQTSAHLARAKQANTSLEKVLPQEPLKELLTLRTQADLAVFGEGTITADTLYPLGQQAVKSALGLYGVVLPALDALLAERESRHKRHLAALTVLTVFSLLLSGYLFVSFRKVLEGGLREVGKHLRAMGDGNLTTQPRAWGTDEVATLIGSLSGMQAALRRVVAQVRQASDGIVAATGQIAGGSQDLSSRTEQSAAQLQKSAAAMEEIAATAKANETQLTDATRIAGENAAVAARGGQIINDVVNTMQVINAGSSKIGEIIGTIDGIAFQTNILALNAAVEAARAGESGRGFAVVASEVRALAQRSAGAAREIKTLVGTSVEHAEAGARVVKDAGAVIGAIVNSSNQVKELLSCVADRARQQAEGVFQTAEAVQDLDSVTQQNAALVQETSAAVQSLKHQALELATEVSAFKLS